MRHQPTNQPTKNMTTTYLTFAGLDITTGESNYNLITTGPDTTGPDTTTENMTTTEKPTVLKNVKKFAYFSRRINPTEKQILIKGLYDRKTKTFCCHYFEDTSRWVFIKATSVVFINFEF